MLGDKIAEKQVSDYEKLEKQREADKEEAKRIMAAEEGEAFEESHDEEPSEEAAPETAEVAAEEAAQENAAASEETAE